MEVRQTHKALKLALLMLYHPLEAIDLFKRYRRGFYGGAFGIALLIPAVRLLQIFGENYAVAGRELTEVNFLLEILVFAAPIATFVLVNSWITGILSGESGLDEIFGYTMYAFVPYLVMTPLLTGISWLLSADLSAFYTLLQTAMWGWVLLLLFLGILRSNDYSFGKSLLVTGIIVIFMLLVWALLMLFFALSCQLYLFIREIVYEITVRQISG